MQIHAQEKLAHLDCVCVNVCLEVGVGFAPRGSRMFLAFVDESVRLSLAHVPAPVCVFVIPWPLLPFALIRVDLHLHLHMHLLLLLERVCACVV